jgi:glycosyltransferase involved in cell wall biosynthesis
VVHVTNFNRLMWDNGDSPTRVIEHGVVVPANVRWSGELPRGVVVINNLASRGRRLGADIFASAQRCVPLDLVGIGAETAGGLGKLPPMELPEFIARYRFFFNPIRYTSLGLAVCEAMAVGLPVVGLATTEMVTVIESDVSGYLDTDVDRLVAIMQQLIRDPAEAISLSDGARRTARERFGIERFAADWDETFRLVTGVRTSNKKTEVAAGVA